MSHAGDMLSLLQLMAEDQVDRGQVTYIMSRSCWGIQKMICIKGVLHLLPPKSSKISMFCALSQNYQHLFEKKYASYSKLSKELKNSIKIKVGQAVLELLIQKQHIDCFDL